MIKFKPLWLLANMLMLFQAGLRADVVVLNSGEVIEGSIIRDDAQSILVQLQYGTSTFSKSDVKSYQTNLQAVAIEKRDSYRPNSRMPAWGTVVAALSKEEWSHSVKQIPATVIDKGVLRRVPYISFKCNAGGYQINVYGDLDNPAGVEIGTFKLISDPAKSNCLSFLARVLVKPSDKDVLEKFPLHEKATIKKDGLTFETTRPHEADSYGGWWITVYDESMLDKARVTDVELASITELRNPPRPQRTSASQQIVTAPQTRKPASVSIPIYIQPDIYSWNSTELADAPSAGGGRVYVRGYQRRDGTYVRPYTRSR